MSNEDAQKIAGAVLYALKCGCVFPVPLPTGRAMTVEHLTKWGALRHLHDVVAVTRQEQT